MSNLAKFYEEIRYKCRVSEIIGKTVSLSKKGSEYLGLCPFHNEKSPSFTINDAKEFYHCFGCGAHGDVIKFMSEKYKISYKDAATKLAQENGIEVKKLSKKERELYQEIDILYSITEMSANFYRSNLTNDAKKYLQGRSIKDDLIEKFEIGFAPNGNVLHKFLETKEYPLMITNKAGMVGKDDSGNIYDIFRNRIMFPIRNIYNKVVGFGGRVIGDGLPKYINSPDNILFHKKDTLYGENIVSSTCYKTNNIIVVEGYFDVISMHNIGLSQSLASLGTAVTKEHLMKIFKMVDEIIVCLDGDKAGINAARKLIDNAVDLINTKKIVSFAMIPDNLDPDSFIRRDGKDSMYKIIQRRISLSEMLFQIELSKINDYKAESKALLEQNLDNITYKITDNYLKKNFSSYFKEQIWKTFSKSQKASNIKMNIVIPELVSNISVIEKSMIYCLIKYPIIANRDDIINFLLDNIFDNNDLEDFKNYIVKEISVNGVDNAEKLIEMIGESSFRDKLDDILKNNLTVPNFDNDESKLLDFWSVLYMKHNLIRVKQEYFNIISSDDLLDQKILKGYESEISRLVTKIDVVTNKILMN